MGVRKSEIITVLGQPSPPAPSAARTLGEGESRQIIQKISANLPHLRPNPQFALLPLSSPFSPPSARQDQIQHIQLIGGQELFVGEAFLAHLFKVIASEEHEGEAAVCLSDG